MPERVPSDFIAQWEAQNVETDAGLCIVFFAAAGKENGETPLALGVRYGSDPLGAKLLNVFDGGAAPKAGLSAGDVVVAVDGLRATQENIEKLLAWHRSKESVNMHAFRRDELMEFTVPIQQAPLDTCYLQLDENANEAQRSIRTGWLGAN